MSASQKRNTRFTILAALLAAFAVAGCGGDPGEEMTDNADVDTGLPGDVAMTDHELPESGDDLVNPERGYYMGADLLDPWQLQEIRAAGHSLVIALVDLGAYRDRPLDDALLARMQAGFDAGVAAGVKFIVRFAYDYDASMAGDDAPLSRVRQHIEQLAPVLKANSHVISVVQAGFVGAWGEWHGSANGLDAPGPRRQILQALLNAVPADRFVQVRTPMAKEESFPGGPLSDSEAFTASARARLGHHNDCFLADDSDLGTYAAPLSEWIDYVANDTLYTPMGGETCAIYQARTDCSAAVPAMEDHHWSYLNAQYHQDVIAGWQQQGCGPEIAQRLGYRLSVIAVSHADAVAPGGSLPVELELVNNGFAAPYNQRPVYLVLTGNGKQHVRRLDQADPRRWHGGDLVSVNGQIDVPEDFEPGTYSLSLWLPDASEELAGDSRYAIRLANHGTWDDATGYNLLSDQVVVVEP